jgi:hypothetical protein
LPKNKVRAISNRSTSDTKILIPKWVVFQLSKNVKELKMWNWSILPFQIFLANQQEPSGRHFGHLRTGLWAVRLQQHEILRLRSALLTRVS